MCTVSFIRRDEGCFITSNRDEHISRPLAHRPEEETLGGIKVLFPKDPRAGGTWFALNELGAVAVLLNGAFVNHKRQLPYAKSRGLILLEVISSRQPGKMLQEMNLEQIEPFTLVLFEDEKLLEFRWDGEVKHVKPLNSEQDYIWSSVTLYDADAIHQRNTLFNRFIEGTREISAQKIVDFHSNNHSDYENGFIIDRTTGLKTFSVTQVVLNSDNNKMRHFDLLNDQAYHVAFSPKQLTPIK
ncbi:NRDE family protein [Flagellimonas flava]|uniref:Transport and Golgi organisation 2 n=1 Tax=Flagellimonas flava TaxID=570519 RepID=A0A1M5N8M4_9FLAO|nr:NRDE family protein [Allomuricauda flava]SHG85956.1 Transport and Golgi organisation 2 [Allomuricauda flava]